MKRRNISKIDTERILLFLNTAAELAEIGKVSSFTCPICGGTAQTTKVSNGHCRGMCQKCGMNFIE